MIWRLQLRMQIPCEIQNGVALQDIVTRNTSVVAKNAKTVKISCMCDQIFSCAKNFMHIISQSKIVKNN